MATLIERIAKTLAVLEQPTGQFLDGVPQMAYITCMVFELGKTRQVFNEFGEVRTEKVFLVAPLAQAPVLPGRITVGGKTYELASVKEYHDMSGTLWGYRVTVAGGA